MADTQTFDEQWLESASNHSAALEDRTGVGVVNFTSPDYVDAAYLSMPGVQYDTDPSTHNNAKPLKFVQFHISSLRNLYLDSVQAKNNANTAASAADASRVAIEANEETRQTNETARQTAEEARAAAETTRQATFNTNEAQRQTTFTSNEAQRQITFTTHEQERQTTFDTNETTRQQTFEDAEADRMAAMMMTEFFVDPQTMHLMVVQPKSDTTDYNVVDGHLMVTFQYDDGL